MCVPAQVLAVKQQQQTKKNQLEFVYILTQEEQNFIGAP